jgi:Putative prokaryotic signal transducing protein
MIYYFADKDNLMKYQEVRAVKVVKICNNRPEAELFASILVESGIECIVQADDCGGARPYMIIPDGVKIITNDEDYEEAVKLFEEMKNAE